MKITRHRKLYIALAVFLALFLLLEGVAVVLLGLSVTVDRTARTLPSYPREDISALAEKESWTEEEYRTLYLQTGLGKSALDRLREDGRLDELGRFQDGLFFEGELGHEFTPNVTTTLHDLLYDNKAEELLHYARLAPVEDGDVIVSSSCHTFGMRNGHAALVVEAVTYSVMESVALGMKSQRTNKGVAWFANAANFIILRLKGATSEERAEIAKGALQNLLYVPYSLTVGVLSKKDQCANGRRATKTHCAHLVWQAYKNCGYDIDSTGGPVVTVRDIARSDLFEVVQVFGFDPLKLW